MAFVDLENASEQVPWDVVQWALRQLGVDEWLMNAIIATHNGETTAVRLNDMESAGFEVNCVKCIKDLCLAHTFSLLYWKLYQEP